MAHYAVRESPPLRGEIPISTSKNAVLPIMCGALLTSGDVRIEKAPDLTDVRTLTALLESCGCGVKRERDALIFTAEDVHSTNDDAGARRMRASVLILGPLLARLGQARIALPGGCAIGQRPIDQHLKGMSALGAKVAFDHGGVTLTGRLRAPMDERNAARSTISGSLAAFSMRVVPFASVAAMSRFSVAPTEGISR